MMNTEMLRVGISGRAIKVSTSCILHLRLLFVVSPCVSSSRSSSSSSSDAFNPLTDHLTDPSSTDQLTDPSSTDHLTDPSSTDHLTDPSPTDHLTDPSLPIPFIL